MIISMEQKKRKEKTVMSVHKNEKNGTWYVMVRYTDWQGNYKQKCKRGRM